jgi:hypothetical protein
MGFFSVQRLTAEVKLSAAASVAIVAGLVFLEGVLAIWSMFFGLGQFRFVANLGILGLIGAPLLLAGSRIGYWFALIDMTLNAIFSVASLTVVVWLAWYNLTTGGRVGGAPEPGLLINVLVALPITWLAVRLLRSADVRRKFNV